MKGLKVGTTSNWLMQSYSKRFLNCITPFLDTMVIEIPTHINDLTGFHVAKLLRDSGFAVVPFTRSRKKPAMSGWRDLKVGSCDDGFLKKWWGNGFAYDIGIMVAEPLVIVDIDGPGDPQTVVEWVNRQPSLAQAPREITARGVHIWCACPDMPVGVRKEERIVAPLPGGLQAELFVGGRAVRTCPSSLENGRQYHFDVTGPVVDLKWQHLKQLFGLSEPSKGTPGRPRRERENAWKSNFSGDLATLDIGRLVANSKYLSAGELLNADTNKYAVRCPWSETHSGTTAHDGRPTSSTVLLHPPGQTPVFKCLHAHCDGRTLRDLLLWLEEREPGLVDACCSEQRALWKGDGDVSPDGRPRILLPGVGREISEFAAEVGKVVGPKWGWFIREEEVTRVSEIRVGTSSYLGFRKVDSTYARTAVEEHVQAGVLGKDPETGEQVFMPTTASPDVTAATLAAPAFTGQLPVISRVLEVPIPLPLATGGYELPVEGYDPRFQTYLRPGAQPIQPMTVDEAMKRLRRIHEGFCLADEQSGVHALARVITPYVRGIMGFEHRPPVWHYHANRPRAGKDYCAGLAPLIYEGRYTEDAPLGTKSEETCKRLVSALRSGRRTMHFANCQGHLDDEYFIGAVTASVIGGRSLGRNGADDDLQLSNEIEFSLSANSGLTFRTDVEPRTRRISLFFAEENPNSRVFPIPDLHGWVLRHRWELISAVATLVHTWLEAGTPNGPTPFSSFKRWGDVVGGIMAYHGLGDPCLPHVDDDGSPADRETAAMAALFKLVYSERPDQWQKKAELYDLIRDSGDDVDALDYFGDLANDKGNQTRFGQLLRRYTGREFGGITLLSDPAKQSQRARFKFTKNAGPDRNGARLSAQDRRD
jgi:hypothetical protein